jgi:hypothetical protein
MVFGFGKKKKEEEEEEEGAADAKGRKELTDGTPAPPPKEPFKKYNGPDKADIAKLASDRDNVFNRQELGKLKGRFGRLADAETGFVDKADFCSQPEFR